jgi:hypothetical protein
MAKNVIEKTIVIKIDGKDAEVKMSDLKKAVKEVADETKKLKEASNTNLGNIASKVNDLKDSFMAGEIGVKGLAKGVLETGKALIKVFITNPILLAITAIVGAVMALYNIFKQFEPVVEAVEQAFAGLKAVWDVIQNGVLALVTGNKTLGETFKGLGKTMGDAYEEGKKLKQIEQDLADQAELLSLSNIDAEASIRKHLLAAKDLSKTTAQQTEELRLAEEEQKKMYDKNLAYALADEKNKLNQLALAMGLSDTQKKLLEEQGLEYYIYLTDNKENGIKAAQEEKDAWVAAQKAKKGVLAQGEAFDETIQNKKNQRIEKDKAAAEKSAADAKKRVEDAKEAALKSAKLQEDIDKDIAKSAKEASDASVKAMEEQVAKEQEIQDRADTEAINKSIETGNAILDEKKKLADEELALNQKLADDKIKQQQAYFDMALMGFDVLRNADQAATQFSINLLNDKLKNGKINQEEYDKKLKEIQIKAAKREKAFAIAQTLINTAQAIMGIWKDFPKVDFGVTAAIMSGVVGALGLAQVAKIKATPIDGGEGGSGSLPSVATPTSTAPNTSFSFATKASVPENKPTRAYVISTDVSNQQQLERQIVSNGTI